MVYAPILKDLYVAIQNEGAYLNGQRLKIVNPPSCTFFSFYNSYLLLDGLNLKRYVFKKI